MQITVNIQAPELAQAITHLAGAISAGRSAAVHIPAQPTAHQEPPIAQPPAQPPQGYVPQQAPAAAPVQPAVPAQAPVQPPAPPQGAVPTAAPTYTAEQLGSAGAALMAAGKQPQLVALLQQFGVPSLMDLPKEQYGAFAAALRGLGAQI